MPNGEICSDITLNTATDGKNASWWRQHGATSVPGYMLRYIHLIDKSCQLTVPIIDYDKIEELGVGMYLGRKK